MSESAELMTYSQEPIANLIAGRLTKVKGKKYGVVKIAQGFQVVPITVLPPYMPPAKPKPITTKVPAGYAALEAKAGEFVGNFELVANSPTYITVKHQGVNKAFGKSTLLDWLTHEPTNTIALKMSVAVAKKRGLI